MRGKLLMASDEGRGTAPRTPFITYLRSGLILFILAACAFLGNILKLQLFFNVDLIFGSIAVFLILHFFGPWWAIGIAAAASSYTYVLWNHPWAIIIFTCEMIVVAFFYKRRRRWNMVTSDTLYWFVLGMPLVFLFYSIVMRMDRSSVLLIMLKQCTNGIFNALIATICIEIGEFFLAAWGRKTGTQTLSFTHILFSASMVFVLIPAIIITVLFSRFQLRTIEEKIQSVLGGMVGASKQTLETWLEGDLEYLKWVNDEGILLPEEGDGSEKDSLVRPPPTPFLSANHFIVIGTCDGRGNCRFFPPSGREGRDVSETASVLIEKCMRRQAELRDRPVLTWIEDSPSAGDSLCIMIRRDDTGFTWGMITGERIRALLADITSDQTIDAALVDSEGNMLGSTRSVQDAMERYLRGEGAVSREAEGLLLWTPEAQTNRSVMTRWSSSIYIHESPIEAGTGLRIIFAAGVAPYQDELHERSLVMLLVILAVVLFALLLSYTLSENLLRSLGHLSRLTTGLPGRIERGESHRWPTSHITETRTLVDNFRTMEQSLRKKFEELERTNGELSEAKNASEAASRAKNRFLAGMSHEFRTPMTSIIGLSDLLISSELTADCNHYARLINRSAHSLLDLLNSVLDFSRIEAGEIEIHTREFELEELLSSLIDLLSVQAAAKSLSLSYSIDDSLPPKLIGDSGKLSEILINLLGNGIKYTGEGSIHLDARRSSGNDDRVDVAFLVQDTGSGISPEQLDLAFTSFTRLPNATESSVVGTGLGLTITKRLVDLLGGKIEVSSQVGSGTSFFITLPFGVPSAEEVQKEDEGEVQVQPATLPPLRILLAEDNTPNRMVIHKMLAKQNLDVIAVSNGREALDQLSQEQVDLLLLDINMPVMNGIETLHAIRNHSGSNYDPFIPVIALTAYALQDDRERIMAAGADEVVTKPIKWEELHRAVQRVMKFDPVPRGIREEQNSITENRGSLLERYKDDQEMLAAILKELLKKFPGQIKELREAVGKGDNRASGKILHSIVNNAGAVDAADLVEHAREMEAVAREQKSGSLSSMLPIIERDIAGLSREIVKLLEELDHPKGE
jgi:signal transduction histidine kinase/DNA-binding NarL/FixJ family response regulator